MVLLKSLLGIPAHDTARQARVRTLARHRRRPQSLVLERLENRLCLSVWSDPVNLGPLVNSKYDDVDPALSPNGLSLYFSSTRPGGFGSYDIYVCQRSSLTDSWGPPQHLGPTINSPGSITYHPNFSLDGHELFFQSTRPGGYGGRDIWVSWRDDAHDDFGWQRPVNLGPGVNSPFDDFGPDYFKDGNTGITTLYFSSNRPGGLGDYDIYASTLQGDGTFGAAVLVPELNSPYADRRMAIRSDGLEMFVVSDRPGGVGNGFRIWASTRANTVDPWSTPVNLGAPINGAGFDVRGVALSSDGNTMFFFSNRPGGFGGYDLWMSTRLPLVADHFTLSAPAGTTAGQSTSLTMTAWDHYGNIATGYTGTVTLASSDPQATLPASYTFTADDNGTHTFGATLLTAGAQSVAVTDTVGEVIGTKAAMVVNPATAVALVIQAPLSVTAGTAFTITVIAVDAYGNIETNYQGTVTFLTSDPDSGVVLPADYTFTPDDGGVHAFADGVTLVTMGDQIFTVTDTVSGITGNLIITVGPGP
jgi:hypothetical protein